MICGETKTKAGKIVKLKLKIEGKPELQKMIAELQRLQAEAKKIKADRQAKIDAIPGLFELETAYSVMSSAYSAYERKSEYGYPAKEAAAWRKAEDDAKKIKNQYPLAAAFLMAKEWAYAANDARASAGKRAMERHINGEDYKIVTSEMEAEWAAAAKRAVENS